MMNNKKRLFVDLDGTCAEWKNLKVLINVDCSEKASEEEIQKEINRQVYSILHSPGYYYNLRPYENVVDAINRVVEEYNNDIDVYILSAAISDNAISDKNRWIDKYMPGIDMSHRIFTKDGADKTTYVPGELLPSDTFIDDYNPNLYSEEPPSIAIKLLNTVNSAETWKGNRLRFDKSGEELAKNIVSICQRELKIQDKDPVMSLDKLLEQKTKKSISSHDITR